MIKLAYANLDQYAFTLSYQPLKFTIDNQPAIIDSMDIHI